MPKSTIDWCPRPMLSPTLLVLLALGAYATPVRAECTSCDPLEKAGEGLYFKLVAPADQPYSMGNLRAYERQGPSCCTLKTMKTAPSSTHFATDTMDGVVYLRGVDGMWDGTRSYGVIAYQLRAGTTNPVLAYALDTKRCGKEDVHALIRRLPGKKAKSRKLKDGRFELSVLIIERGLPVRLLRVAEHRGFMDKARLIRADFSKDCKTLTYREPGKNKTVRFKVPKREIALASKEINEIRLVVLGVMRLPKPEKKGQPWTFPIDVAFSVEKIMPVGEVGMAGLKELRFRVGKKRYEGLGLALLPPASPIQAVLKGNDQIPLKEFKLESIVHR